VLKLAVKHSGSDKTWSLHDKNHEVGGVIYLTELGIFYFFHIQIQNLVDITVTYLPLSYNSRVVW
jgi:hypothetical protein